MTEAPSNDLQRASPSFRLPALDKDFLLSDAMRGVRIQLEFGKAELALKAWGVRSTLVVFGSARVNETGPANHRRWYAQARRFGALASLEGGAVRGDGDVRDNVIATGGGPGIMAAANRGAAEAGAPSIGFNITLPSEQEPNPWTTPDLTFRFHYFAMRKMHLAMRANALIIFPGGFGTLDELFEILTLRQTGKAPPIPVILFDRAFWTSLISFEVLEAQGFISPADLDLFTFAETAEEAWRALLDGGLVPGRPLGPKPAL